MLLDEDAPDAEEFVICWLAPVIRAAAIRRLGDPLPFAVVSRVAGADDQHTGTDDPVVQVDVFADGVVAASDSASLMHRRMNLLGRDCSDVTLSDGTVANCDFAECSIKPFRMEFEDDTVVRYTARYTLGLSFVAV